MRDKTSFVYAGLVVVLLVTNGGLVWRNHRLRETLNGLEDIRNRETEIARGTILPSLRAFDQSGHPAPVTYGTDKRPTLIFAFSPSCPFCKKNWQRWLDLEALPELAEDRVRIMFLDLTGTADARFFLRYPTHLRTVRIVDQAAGTAYHLGRTPETLLVSGSGIAEGVWSGMLDQPSVDAIRLSIRDLTRGSEVTRSVK